MNNLLRVEEGHDLHPESTRPDRSYWYTVDDLVDHLGYRRKALVDLFGDATPCLDGEFGWTVSSVAKVEREVIAPALRLAKTSFVDDESADVTLARVDFGGLDRAQNGPSPADIVFAR
ncbi:hypothetical protein CH254_04540 [Rhodococcus sp. 06-412-2C]|uniref:hypothetical protein n=1 Tax=unclassified Rhodococcus (in: high G+C Gram-positive bacteria) TaxID=192944 RepID=UPI000B9B72FD|nr:MULTISPECIES: hypothetical protein [unclassified Rhodococcus (in: high G+C Gram-positive bacteria)]OZC91752.1 hypothetical protein CH254_04540 [Rhodococcus sp. 06-412-2C]OZC92320.1 hypothetical protein CH279_25815 [Rhodococcus sp. 06-412-2B]